VTDETPELARWRSLAVAADKLRESADRHDFEGAQDALASAEGLIADLAEARE